jgi:putative acetyltransferase
MIRPMELSDISRVAEIHVFAQRKAYRGIFSDEHLFKETTVAKRSEFFANQFQKDGREGFVFDDGIIRGFLITSPCLDEDRPDSLEIERIFVDPLMHRLGIGSKLIDYCEKIARQSGFNEICLYVVEGNILAREFYNKNGYAPGGAERKRQLGDTGVSEIRYIKSL